MGCIKSRLVSTFYVSLSLDEIQIPTKQVNCYPLAGVAYVNTIISLSVSEPTHESKKRLWTAGEKHTWGAQPANVVWFQVRQTK